MSTPTSTDLAAVVGGIYEAFGRGDVAAIVDACAEDVAWDSWADHSAQHAGVEHLAPRTGRDGVTAFFGAIGGWQIHDFRVLDIIAGERQVAVEIAIDATLPTGKRLRDEELHLWTFDEHGKVCRFRHYVDTAKHIEAARA